MLIEELPGGVLQGYSAALNLNLRWDNGQLVWHDPATGRRIVTLEDALVRADTAETRARPGRSPQPGAGGGAEPTAQRLTARV